MILSAEIRNSNSKVPFPDTVTVIANIPRKLVYLHSMVFQRKNGGGDRGDFGKNNNGTILPDE